MQYRLFFPFALVGAVLWGVGLTWLGSLLGTIPFAQEHIDLLIVAVIVVTLAPVAIGALRARTSGSGAAEPEETPEEALHSIEEVVKGD